MTAKHSLVLKGVIGLVPFCFSGCGGGGISSSIGGSTSSASITISPGSVVVPVGQQQQFLAVVTGGSGNGDINWTVSCASAQCGTVLSQSTHAYLPTTYSAPVAAPANRLTAILEATSISDAGVSASVTITVPTTVVSVSPSTVSVPLGGKQLFTAAVNSLGGVTWSVVEALQQCFNATMSCDVPTYLTCSPACGTISPSSTANGAPTTYSAPMEFNPPGTPCGPEFGSCTVFGGLFLQANAQTDVTAFGRASILLIPVSVSLSANEDACCNSQRR